MLTPELLQDIRRIAETVEGLRLGWPDDEAATRVLAWLDAQEALRQPVKLGDGEEDYTWQEWDAVSLF
jgi:hypothetical protein